MNSQALVSDTFLQSGERLDRLRQALKVAGHQARVAQSSGYDRHVEDALAEIEEAISDHLARIENSLDDDKAEAEVTGELTVHDEHTSRITRPCDASASNLAWSSTAGARLLPRRALEREARSRHDPVQHDQSRYRQPDQDEDGRWRDRSRSPAPRSGQGIRVQEGPVPPAQRYRFRQREGREFVGDEHREVCRGRHNRPIYYASSYYLAPDGDSGRDVYAVLCEAIAETGKVALARVVIGQRERTIALRAMPGGLVAHTLDEQRDINDAKAIFDGAAEVETDPEMVALAKQLIQRQTTTYDPSDLEDRYETRLGR